MREGEIRQWMHRRKAKDLWWYSFDGQVSDKPLPLSTVKDKARKVGSQPLILQVQRAEREKYEWFRLEMPQSNGASQTSSERSGHTAAPAFQPNHGHKAVVIKRKFRVSPLQIFILLMSTLSLALLLTFVLRQKTERPTPAETTAAPTQLTPTLKQADRQPPLQTKLVWTPFVLFVENQTQSFWQGYRIMLQGENGATYQFESEDEVMPGETINLPLNRFENAEGDRFRPGQVTVDAVEISVPGYAPYDQRL